MMILIMRKAQNEFFYAKWEQFNILDLEKLQMNAVHMTGNNTNLTCLSTNLSSEVVGDADMQMEKEGF